MPARVATRTSTVDTSIAIMIVRGVRALLWITDVPMVIATAVVKINGPIMLQIAVRKTAFTGERTFVATTVAMAWAASLSPLMKFIASAKTDAKQNDGIDTGHVWLIEISDKAWPTSLHFSITFAMLS